MLEGYDDEFEQIWIDEEEERDGALARPAVQPDVTCSAATEPPAPELPLEDILDDPDYDRISDCDEIVEAEAIGRGDPTAVRRRAMAEDFSEGKLETLVDSPQKELAGTQNPYISYRVTTKVTTPF